MPRPARLDVMLCVAIGFLVPGVLVLLYAAFFADPL